MRINVVRCKHLELLAPAQNEGYAAAYWCKPADIARYLDPIFIITARIAAVRDIPNVHLERSFRPTTVDGKLKGMLTGNEGIIDLMAALL
ncbi:hypothetical protein HJA93_10060 [Rhizobium binae]|nr:hypothetical protein [Rhizobium binae]